MTTPARSVTLAAGLAAGVYVALTGIAAAQQPAAPAAASPSDAPRDGRGPDGTVFPPSEPFDYNDREGFIQLFDGKSLNNWDGQPVIWRVEDEAIFVEAPKESRSLNTFVIYRGSDSVVHDFDLKVEVRVEGGGGGGIQYRSKVLAEQNAGRAGTPGRGVNDPRGVMIGPSIDFWAPPLGNSYGNVLNGQAFTGQLYSQNSRGILAYRGEVTQQRPGKRSRMVGLIGNQEELGGYQRINDWNQMMVVVRGGTFLNLMNGRLMSAMVDDDPASTSNGSGLIGLQIETAPCKIAYHNIWLKKIN